MKTVAPSGAVGSNPTLSASDLDKLTLFGIMNQYFWSTWGFESPLRHQQIPYAMSNIDIIYYLVPSRNSISRI